MSATVVSYDGLEEAVIASPHKRLGVSIPASLNVDSVLLHKAAQVAAEMGSATLVCASKWHARQLQALAVSENLSSQVKIAFMMDVALEYLKDPAIQEATKRSQRVLDENEVDILTEDIKVTGFKMARLREMLKFFYHSISDTSAEKEGWIKTSEEATVFAVLEENLEARRACLPCEPAVKAYQGLVNTGTKPAPQSFIVDDFGALSLSSQRLLEYLSDGHIIAFGNDSYAVVADEPYPSPAGMRGFMDCEDTQVFEVAAPMPAKMTVETMPTPIMEFEHVAAQIQNLSAAGTAFDHIVVSAPNSTWAKQIAKTCTESGIPVVLDLHPSKVKGDPREPQLCGDIKLHAFVKLLADPADFSAYRTFIGAGDWLLRSDGFLELLAFARDHDLSTVEAAQVMRQPEMSEKTTVSFRKFLAPMAEYDELSRLWNTGTVADIVKTMQQHGMPLKAHQAALGDPAGKPDIDAFIKSFAAKALPVAAGHVIITTYDRSHGHPCQTLIMTGMIDGFMPKRDAVDDSFDLDHRAHAMEREGHILQSIEEIAAEQILYTSFDHDVIENTAAMHMVTTRIYQKDGRRMAHVSPSSLLH